MGIFSSIFGNAQPDEANKFEMLRDDGVRAMQMGELPYAIKCFTTALEIKHDLKTLGFLAEAYLYHQDYQEALPLLEELSKSEIASNELDLFLAQTQGHLKLYVDEKKTCEQILNKNDQEYHALYFAAEAEHGLDQDFQAIAHLTQCLTIHPGYRNALYLRAQILSEMNQWKDAMEDIEALVTSNADCEEYLLLRAKGYTLLGQTDNAIADLQKVCELNPFNQDAVLQLGAVYEQGTLWDKALALYDEAIDMQPDFAMAYKARGGVKHHLKDEQGAADDLKKCLELAPEKADELTGEYSNIENEMNTRYRNMNPYGF